MINKKSLLKLCLNQLSEKIEVAKRNMEEAQASANNETKSSAGDKYETGRAMSQRERDLHARQLAELLNMKKLLFTINPNRACDQVELGALVKTSTTLFFISASLGELKIQNENVMAVSAISPIAQAMLGKKQKSILFWAGKEMLIEEIG